MKRFYALAATLVVAASAFASVYTINDGSADDSIGLNGATGLQIYWSTSFTAVAGAEKITSVDIMFGFNTGAFAKDGSPVRLSIAMDANGDGIADTGGVISDLSTTVTGANTNTFQNYDLPDVVLNAGDGFVVSAIIDSNADNRFPSTQDTTSPVSGRNYIGFDTTVDPNNVAGITAGQADFVENFGLPGNWMINANAEAVPEPATMTVLALGALGLIRRRRS